MGWLGNQNLGVIVSGGQIQDGSVGSADLSDTAIQTKIHAAASKTIANADEIGVLDSTNGWNLKKTTWASMKTEMSSTFDTSNLAPKDGTGTSGTWPISITGASPTLTTARNINGTSFNGSANITTASWGTGRTITIGSTGKSVDGSGDVSWSLTDIGATPSTRSISTTAPVSGGGNLSADRTISLAAGYGDTQNPYASKTAKFVLAAPNGADGVPTFRAIVASDIPTLNQNTTGSAATASAVSGTTVSCSGRISTTEYVHAAYLNMSHGSSDVNFTAIPVDNGDGYLRKTGIPYFNIRRNRVMHTRETNGGTCVHGVTYSIYTGSGAITMYLPLAANTTNGDTIRFVNLLNQWATYNFTLARADANTRIHGLNENLICDKNIGGFDAVCAYHDGTAYWVIV
jgi:hypothetical protein